MRALPALQEANFVSQQLGRGVQVAIKIHTEKAELGATGTNSFDRTIVYIQAQHATRYSQQYMGKFLSSMFQRF